MKTIFTICLLFSFNLILHAEKNPKVFNTYSENGEYYIKSLKFENNSTLDRSFIYKTSDNSLLYHIDIDLNLPEINDWHFLNNHGNMIAYINPNLNDGEELQFYQNGKLLVSYNYEFFGIKKELNKKKDSSINQNKPTNHFIYKNYYYHEADTIKIKNLIDLTYSNFYRYKYKSINNRSLVVFKKNTPELDSFAHTFPIFLNQDTLYLITKNKEVYAFDMNSGNCLYNKDLLEVYSNIKSKAKFVEVQIPKEELWFSEPTLSNNTSITEFIEKEFNWVGNSSHEKLRKKKYFIDCFIEIDFNGNPISINFSKNQDSVLNKVKELLLKQKFKHNVNLSKFDVLVYSYSQKFCSKSDSIALAEYLKDSVDFAEFKKIIPTLDTLWGRYIPKNIEETMTELDKHISTDYLIEIDSLSSENEMDKLHLSLGMWFRNYYGLWAGSRIYAYVEKEFGIQHPDDVSAFILRCYFRHRHKLPLELDKYKIGNEKNK